MEKSNSCLPWLSSPSCLLHQKVPQPYPNHNLFYCSPLKGGVKDPFSLMGIFLRIYQLYVPFIAHIILVESLSSGRLMYEAKMWCQQGSGNWDTKATSSKTEPVLTVFPEAIDRRIVSEAVVKLSLLAWITLAQLPCCRADNQVNYLCPYASASQRTGCVYRGELAMQGSY